MSTATAVAWRSEKWRKLSRRDLAAFDDISTAAVLAAMDRGGVGRISSKGHAILRSPNGQTMSVSPNSNRSKQVVDIRLRKLFPVTAANGEPKPNNPEAKASSNNHQAEATTPTPTTTILCTNKACKETFATQGALYSHVHKEHVVCDEPGCLLSWDSRRQMVSHRNIVHRGMAPRRLAKQHGKATDRRGRALVGIATPDEATIATPDVPTAEPEPKGKGFSKMTPEQRREAGRKGAQARWEKARRQKAKAMVQDAAAEAAMKAAEEAESSEKAAAGTQLTLMRDVHAWVTTERQEKDELIAGLERQLEAVRAELAEANAKLDKVRDAFS